MPLTPPSRTTSLPHARTPRYVATSAADHRYHLPRSLQEFKVLCSAARKPLTLLGLLQELRGQPTVVFASSLDTTHKWGSEGPGAGDVGGGGAPGAWLGMNFL